MVKNFKESAKRLMAIDGYFFIACCALAFISGAIYGAEPDYLKAVFPNDEVDPFLVKTFVALLLGIGLAALHQAYILHHKTMLMKLYVDREMAKIATQQLISDQESKSR